MAIDEPKGYLSLILGIIIFLLGALPLLSKWKILPFSLPGIVEGLLASFVLYILAAVGVVLLIDGFLEWGEAFAIPTLVVALIIIAIGAVQILNSFNVIGFSIPFLSQTIYYILFVLEGLFLAIAAFIMP